MDTVRVFVGCMLDLSSTRRIMEAQRTLRVALDPAVHELSWVPPTNFHITLRFLGDIDQGLVPAIRDELDQVRLHHGPFRIEVGGFGTFPDSAEPRVVYLEILRAEPLVKLVNELDTVLAGLGFAAEPRVFRPHVTVARVRKATAPLGFEKVPCAARGTSAKVTGFSLYRSDLLRAGAEYSSLSSHVLEEHRAQG